TARQNINLGETMAHTETEILAGLAEIVNEETGVATDDVKLDKSFTDDLDIDSISMMTIVVNAEEKFDVRIPDEEVKNLATVGDAATYIEGAQSCVPSDARDRSVPGVAVSRPPDRPGGLHVRVPIPCPHRRDRSRHRQPPRR